MSEQYLRVAASEIVIAQGDKRIILSTKEEFTNLKHLCEVAITRIDTGEKNAWYEKEK